MNTTSAPPNGQAAPRPQTQSVTCPTLIADNIPQELRDLTQWVVYRIEFKDNGDSTKIPYQPLQPGEMARVNDPTTWSTFDQALAAYQRGVFSGIGFVFTDTDPYCGIDFDGCLDGGEFQEWVRKWLEAPPPAYAEISPSGKGIKVFCKARLPGKGGSRKTGEGKHKGIEIYDRLRFFAVTGNRLWECLTVPDYQAGIDRLYDWVKEPRKARAQTPSAIPEWH